jgi:hypothetical protein
MNKKQYWIGLALVFCIAMSLGNFVNLPVTNSISKDTSEVNTLEQEPFEVSKMVNVLNDGSNANYTWTSWANASDSDKDLQVDTLNVYYNFSNFNVTGYFQIDLVMEIFSNNNDSPVHIDYESDEFYEYVEPNNSYLWKYEWYAWEDGNYSMTVDQIVWGDYNVTFIHQEVFNWTNIHRFDLLREYNVSIKVSDSDQDMFNDTINFTYSLNFSTTGFFALEYSVQISYWNDYFNQWDYLTTKHFYDDFTLNEAKLVNWTFQFRAWFDGDYQFEIRIEDDYNPGYPLLVEEEHEWYNAYAFSLINNWESALTLLDEDGDSSSDTFSLVYTLNFSISGEIDLRMSIDIMRWIDSAWEYFDYESEYLITDVVAGEEQQLEILWKSRETGRFRVDVQIHDEDMDVPIIEESFIDFELTTYDILADWKAWTEELDKDQDGTIDTIILNYGLKFKKSGMMDLRIQVGVQEQDSGGSSYTRHYTNYFHGEVTTTSYYHCYFEFSAYELKNYNFDVEISILDNTMDRFVILEDWVMQWSASDIFNSLKNWSYTTSESDLDYDGLIDTLIIDYEFEFSFTGQVILYIEFDVEMYNTVTDQWEYESSRIHQFIEEVTPGVVYESTFRLSASVTADYRIEFYGSGELFSGDQQLFSDTIYWSGNKHTLFNDYNFVFTPKDSDSDGKNDSLNVQFNFNCTADQTLLVAFMFEIRKYNPLEDRWEYISSDDPYIPEVHIFNQDVIADTWYSWNYTWGVPSNGTFNISVRLSSPYELLDAYEDSYLFEDATEFDRISFDTEILVVNYDTNQDGLNDTTEFELNFNFDSLTGLVDLNISFEIFTLANIYDYSSWNTESFLYPYQADITPGIWYHWSTNFSIDPSLYGIYLIRIYDRGVPIFYTMGYLFEMEPFPYIYEKPLLPVIPPDPETTTVPTTTTTTTTTTTIQQITPGLSLLVSLAVIVCLLVNRNYNLFKKNF